jgi:hypothetical protein
MSDTLTSVRAVVSTTAARWTALAETLSDDLLARKPAAGEWSAVECLQHLIDTEQAVFAQRVQAFLDGRDFPGFDPDAQGTTGSFSQPTPSLAAEFARLRASSLKLLATLKQADLERRARHQDLGPVTLAELLNEWAAHDLMHLVQAERALMQPFIAGSGPWQPYFAAHVVSQ